MNEFKAGANKKRLVNLATMNVVSDGWGRPTIIGSRARISWRPLSCSRAGALQSVSKRSGALPTTAPMKPAPHRAHKFLLFTDVMMAGSDGKNRTGADSVLHLFQNRKVSFSCMSCFVCVCFFVKNVNRFHKQPLGKV